jgi:hypothetical protein
VGSTDLLFELGISRGFDGDWNEAFESWVFSEDQPVISSIVGSIKFEFWGNNSDYDVEWKYDERTNSYLRINGGKSHTDWELDKPQLSAKNVVVMFVGEEGPVDEEKHLYYETVGAGEMILAQNGAVIEGTWEKPSQFARTKFYDKGGREVSFVKGVVWIEAVPEGNIVEY